MTCDDVNRGLRDRVNTRGERVIDFGDLNRALGNRVNTRGERAIDGSDLSALSATSFQRSDRPRA